MSNYSYYTGPPQPSFVERHPLLTAGLLTLGVGTLAGAARYAQEQSGSGKRRRHRQRGGCECSSGKKLRKKLLKCK